MIKGKNKLSQNTWFDKKTMFGNFTVGLLLPITLTLGMHFSSNNINRKQTNIQRKEALLTNFTQSFSQFSSIAGDYYYNECLDVSNDNVDDECKDKNNEKKCHKLKNQKKLFNIQQPEGVLSQIIVLFDSREIKRDAEYLFEKQKEIYIYLGCSADKDQFDKTISSIDEPYNRMIRNMAKELAEQ